VAGEPHQQAIQEIAKVIGIYAEQQRNDIFRSGGGRRLFTINAAGNTSLRVTLTRGANNVQRSLLNLKTRTEVW
jgi:hypothetical protein